MSVVPATSSSPLDTPQPPPPPRPVLSPLQLPTSVYPLQSLSTLRPPSHKHHSHSHKARRAFSEDCLPLVEGGGGPEDRVERWRVGVLSADEGTNHHTEAQEEQLGNAHGHLEPADAASSAFFSSSSPFDGDHFSPLDPHDESFLALAALHDPTLFPTASAASFAADKPSSSSGGGGGWPSQSEDTASHRFDALEGSSPDSPTALEFEVGRGRRRREKEREDRRRREESFARTTSMSPAALTKKVLGTSIKANASVAVQPKSASTSPRSPPRAKRLAHPPPSGTSPSKSTAPKHTRQRSSASDQLLAVQDSFLASTSPLDRPSYKRRHSSALTSFASTGNLPDGPPRHSTSAALLSSYLTSGRRSSLPTSPATPSPGSRGSTPSPSSPLAQPRPVRGRDRSDTHSTSTHSLFHLPSLASLPSFPSLSLTRAPHLHFHTHRSPSPRPPSPSATASGFPFPAPSSSTSAGEKPPSHVAWSSIEHLTVRFRPSTSRSVESASPAASDALGANQWLLGLQDLAAGGARAWDPRAASSEGGDSAQGEQGGEKERRWPTVSTAIGAPPSVEVRYQGGGRKVVEVGGMGPEEIMQAVLAIPV
ncbi:hypothetical protein JCM10207_007168 [Rhodosporidiobolus poonsookiae]